MAQDPGDGADDFMDLLAEENDVATISVADPIAPWNRAVFTFNDKCYVWVIKPTAKRYQALVPEPARKGVQNFFHNLIMPVRFVNAVLQGKGDSATAEICRFLMNTATGMFGFRNPAEKYPSLNPDSEDLGQTFGHYGVGNGFYIVWPLFGSSTLRDTVGLVGDRFLKPTAYLDPALLAAGVDAYKTVNQVSLVLEDYETLRNASVEPYVAFKDAYLQLRQRKVER